MGSICVGRGCGRGMSGSKWVGMAAAKESEAKSKLFLASKE
jgi:F0F1-type ATP synthase membrane subunit c/vacuolar-type H+-ATPase subunit K